MVTAGEMSASSSKPSTNSLAMRITRHGSLRRKSAGVAAEGAARSFSSSVTSALRIADRVVDRGHVAALADARRLATAARWPSSVRARAAATAVASVRASAVRGVLTGGRLRETAIRGDGAMSP